MRQRAHRRRDDGGHCRAGLHGGAPGLLVGFAPLRSLRSLGVAIDLRDRMKAAGLVCTDPVNKKRRAGGQRADLAIET